jgi:hypothetical protein
MVDVSRNNDDNKLIEQLQELSSENDLLREEIKEITAAGEKYKREMMEARERVE